MVKTVLSLTDSLYGEKYQLQSNVLSDCLLFREYKPTFGIMMASNVKPMLVLFVYRVNQLCVLMYMPQVSTSGDTTNSFHLPNKHTLKRE